MVYVTVAQLKASLADAGGAGARTAASLPDARLASALEEATGEVTGRLTGSFTLPDPGTDPLVSPDGIPGLLRTIIVGIAGYLASLEFNGTLEVQERDPVVLRYARAKELLGLVARGELVVDGITATGTAAPSGTAEVFGGINVDLAGTLLPDYDGRHVTPPYTGGGVWG